MLDHFLGQSRFVRHLFDLFLTWGIVNIKILPKDSELVVGDPRPWPLVLLLLEKARVELMLVQLGQVGRQRIYGTQLGWQLRR